MKREELTSIAKAIVEKQFPNVQDAFERLKRSNLNAIFQCYDECLKNKYTEEQALKVFKSEVFDSAKMLFEEEQLHEELIIANNGTCGNNMGKISDEYYYVLEDIFDDVFLD